MRDKPGSALAAPPRLSNSSGSRSWSRHRRPIVSETASNGRPALAASGTRILGAIGSIARGAGPAAAHAARGCVAPRRARRPDGGSGRPRDQVGWPAVAMAPVTRSQSALIGDSLARPPRRSRHRVSQEINLAAARKSENARLRFLRAVLQAGSAVKHVLGQPRPDLPGVSFRQAEPVPAGAPRPRRDLRRPSSPLAR